MVTYDTATLYLESATTNQAKVIAIDAIITALLSTAATAASNENISEYSLNDGQVIIKTNYRGVESIYKSIAAFRKLRQEYINMINGRVIRCVDGKNFIGKTNLR